MCSMNEKVWLTYLCGEKIYHYEIKRGTNLRKALLEKGHSPYTSLTQKLNCGGRGMCATCGVWIEVGAPAPTHWHDKLARACGYPRLSCQVRVDAAMKVTAVMDKKIWGKRRLDQ